MPAAKGAEFLMSMEAAPCPRRWGLHCLQTFLLTSMLYVALTMGWVICSMHSTGGQGDSVSIGFGTVLEKMHHPVTNTLQKLKDKVEEMHRTPTPRELEEVEHARSVPNLPSGQIQLRNITCIGWRATGNCQSDGPREVSNDLDCHQEVPDGSSGYCEVQDANTGELFRVMRRTCAKYKKSHVFRCADAHQFVNYHVEALAAVKTAIEPDFSLPNVQSNSQGRDGIVMVVYPKLIASAYATIRTLRDVLGCSLPIEIWFRQDEIDRVPRSLSPLQQLAQNVTVSQIFFQKINDSQAVRFEAKIFALYNSGFERILFLDADNVPVRDPASLFKSPEFEKTGAVFWPDYWNPHYTIFHLHEDSLLWELLDMPYVDMFEQESGQVLIDRRRHAAPLELVRFFAFHQPNPLEKLKLLWGDKDLFRFAWIKLNVPFYMIQTPPAVAGAVNGTSFCGMTMVQHDAEGKVVFLHRNAKKLTGEVLYKPVNYHIEARKRLRSRWIKQGIHKIATEEEVVAELMTMKKTPPPPLEPAEPDGIADQIIWTHMLSFRKDAPRSEYKVKSFSASPDFPEKQRCYGERDFARSKYFDMQSFDELSFSKLESHVRRFGMEAAQIRHG
ncbi:putative Mannosyltransferase [Phytophthora infestans]|uniref:Putative Mannosyltransferase n=1 Tax=Phytophthora infestans TaxID=4787 RepID=A0A833WFJ6_PHYIN|nr:putative Mannosyltransferase [Phytophthora infestans]